MIVHFVARSVDVLRLFGRVPGFRRTLSAIVVVPAVCFLSMFSACDSGLGRFTPIASCTAQCYGRVCGDDGCSGTCGQCSDGLFCEPVTGLCLGEGRSSVTGRLSFEYMLGNVNQNHMSIVGPEEAPATDMLLVVTDAGDNVIGANSVDGADGSFSIPISRSPRAGDRLFFSTVWAPDGKVLMAVLDPLSDPNDLGRGTFDPFVWVVEVPSNGRMGDMVVSTEQYSGAINVFLMNRLAFESMVRPMADSGYDGAVTPLAILFGPWEEHMVPCTCYHGTYETHIGTSRGPQLDTRISIVDRPGDPSAWGWSVLFHEFGHYVLDNYSKDNSLGGTHYMGQTYAPKFSFSEGWATFTSLVTATMWFGETWPVYWDIQGGSSFWVDFENGMYHGDSFASFAMTFPSMSESPNQKVDENWVARTLYAIWDGSGSSEDPDATMTLDQMGETLTSERFLRGFEYARDADLHNFLDSAICLFPEKKGPLAARVRTEFKFPYSGNPECSQYAVDLPGGLPVPSAFAVSAGSNRDRLTEKNANRTGRVRPEPIRPFKLNGIEVHSAIPIEPRVTSR